MTLDKIITKLFWLAVAVSFIYQLSNVAHDKYMELKWLNYERGLVTLKVEDKDVEFNCNTDSECYRDCMDLLDDADACERGLMEGGR